MLSSPKPCGRWSSRFCRPSLRSRRPGDRAPRIGRRWPASSWFCARAYRGSTCRIPGWAAAARRVGAGWVDGRCLGCAPPGDAGAATGCGPARLVARCSRKRQVASENRGPSPGPNPTDRGQAGHEAPPRRERQGHAARPDAHGGQPPRQPHAGHARVRNGRVPRVAEPDRLGQKRASYGRRPPAEEGLGGA